MANRTVLELNVEPGIVLAVNFILFDVIILAVVDSVLARFVCWRYYRRINEGMAVSVQSADIPGVTTFLLDRHVSLPNVIATVVKVVFLGIVLAISLKIDASSGRSVTEMELSGAFVFNASEPNWHGGPHRLVARRWDRVRNCRVTNKSTSFVRFYKVAFNLEGDRVIHDEVDNDADEALILPIDDSVVCMSDKHVEGGSTPMVTVTGCTVPGNCSGKSVDERKGFVDFQLGDSDYASMEEGTGVMTFSMRVLDAGQMTEIWPEYTNGSVTCMKTKIGPILSRKDTFIGCLIVAYKENTTIVERWEYNETASLFTRSYAGPVFEGILDIGPSQRTVNLQKPGQALNWETFSSVLIADAAVYKREKITVRKFGQPHAVTLVPYGAIVLAAISIAFALLFRIAVHYTIGKDERPQLNSINGLSSIGREENQPTGRSYQSGRGMILGFSSSHGNTMHFGPVRSESDVIPPHDSTFRRGTID